MKREFGIKSTIVSSFLLSSDDSKYSREWDISIFREIDEEEIFQRRNFSFCLSFFISFAFFRLKRNNERAWKISEWNSKIANFVKFFVQVQDYHIFISADDLRSPKIA